MGMGKAAYDLSDYTILSSDNPRTEPIPNIMKDIEQGFLDRNNEVDTSKFIKIPDRREAIKKAISMAKPSDIIIIAGKRA